MRWYRQEKLPSNGTKRELKNLDIFQQLGQLSNNYYKQDKNISGRTSNATSLNSTNSIEIEKEVCCI